MHVRRMTVVGLVVLLLPPLMWTGAVLADDALEETGRNASEVTVNLSSEPPWSQRFGRWLEAKRDSFSQAVTLSAEEIDRYLAAGDPLKSRINNSQVLIQFRQRLGDEGDHKLELDVRARLRLPRTLDRLRLTFDSDPEDFESMTKREREQVPSSVSSREVKDNAVIGLELNEDGRRWKRRYRIGMHLRFPLDPFIRASVIRNFTFDEYWRGRFRESLAFFHIQGLRAETRFDLLRRLNPNWLFRSLSAAEFVDQEENWELLQSLSLQQRLSDRSTFEYQLGISGDSRPELRKSSYWLRTEFRHRLYEDWLFGVVAPELLFPRNDDFHPEPALLLKLQVYFGQPPD